MAALNNLDPIGSLLYDTPSNKYYFINGAGQFQEFTLASSSESAYTSYVALLTQSGTSDPVATTLSDTIGGLNVYRSDVGEYIVEGADGTFPENKTVLFIGLSNSVTYAFTRTSDTVLTITTNILGTPSDDCLVENAIEVRIYP